MEKKIIIELLEKESPFTQHGGAVGRTVTSQLEGSRSILLADWDLFYVEFAYSVSVGFLWVIQFPFTIQCRLG